ncbi:hypothetical protein ACPOLB_21025 [Rubrivivax sp. RP6-9]|uniref:hypothetical protein n=1 Tax=Rubrivivax sp. RP6-9 TaxID=3415750 RepID=UPI003CC5C1FD
MRARPLSGPALLAALAATLAAGPAAAADGHWRVFRERAEWVIEAHAGPRDAVARQLAALSGSTWALAAGPAPLAGARPLTRRWRGRDLADAWGVVLGGVADHAVQCRPQGCRVWVLGLRPAPQPSAVASPSPSAPVPPVAAVRAAWQAPGAEHGGTAASTAEPVALPLTEDPPGLFPSQ